METATKKVQICQYKAYCEEITDRWGEVIVVYDENDKEVARSGSHHPEGIKSLHWQGFEFMAMGYSGNPRTLCYVKMNDKVFLEKSTE